MPQVQDVQCSTSNSQEGFNYLSLPPEIRNMVMGYVLVPGDVYPLSSPRPAECQTLRDEQLPEDRPRRLPGFQLLAACKQTQAEGQRLYYEENTFHLPPGPVEHTEEWLVSLRPEHRDMIKSVCFVPSFNDLTPAILLESEQFGKFNGRKYNMPEHQIEAIIVGRALNRLELLWRDKMAFLPYLKTLEAIYLKEFPSPHTINVHRVPTSKIFDEIKRAGDDAHREALLSKASVGWHATRNCLFKHKKLCW